MKQFPLLLLTLAVLAGSPGAASAQEKRIEAYGTKLLHRDGSRTETQKMGDSMQIRQETFDKNNVLIQIRVFQLDNLGRHRQGVIWDGRKNPLASIDYLYSDVTNKLTEERMHNKNGRLIRRLFYPGAFPNDPRYANRIVAFNFDPDRPDDKGTEVKGEVKPIAPVKSAEDEFDPSIPGASTAAAAPAAAPSSADAPKEKVKRRFGFMPQKKGDKGAEMKGEAKPAAPVKPAGGEPAPGPGAPVPPSASAPTAPPAAPPAQSGTAEEKGKRRPGLLPQKKDK